MRAGSEGITVLHVDDDSAFLEMAAAFLDRADDALDVETKTSAEEGLERLREGDIDCVVSDYEMPGTDGIEFLRAVRERYPDLPFVLFTGKGSETVAAEAVEADVSGYLQKGGTDTLELLHNRVRDAAEDYRIASSYREYRTIVESLTDPVYVLDEAGLFTDVNEAFTDLVGYDRATILGSDPSLIKSPETVAEAERHLGRILSSEGPDDVLFETEILTADGRTVPCEDHMGVIPYEGEQFRGSVGVLRDITDRRQSEEYRRRLYELATDDAPFEAVCRRMLELGCERLGVPEGKLVRVVPDADRHETVVASDIEKDGDVAALSETYCRHVVESVDTVAFHDVSGSDFRNDPAREAFGHACYAGAEVTVDGDRYGTVCFFGPEALPEGFTDAELTYVELIGRLVGQLLERRRAETRAKRRERALKRIHDVVSGRDRTCDERIRELVALGRETLGTDYGTVAHVHGDRYEIEFMSADGDAFGEGDVVPLSETACERTVAEDDTQSIPRLGADPTYAEHPVHTEIGFECYVGTPVYLEGDVYGTLCFSDFEGREEPFSEWETTLVELLGQWVSHLLGERKKRTELARERDRLGEFAGVVAHDLRGPLNVAAGQLELAADACECDATDTFHAAAGDALQRMDALIDSTLALARQGRTVGETEAVPVGAVVEEVASTMLATPPAVDPVGELPTVEADRERLRELFGNLLANAAEHGGPDVTVEIGRIDGPDPGIYLEDDGPGIPEADRERVFDRGFSSADGMGYGLSIVERIATAHGWEIRATGGDGGARFEITGIELSGA